MLKRIFTLVFITNTTFLIFFVVSYLLLILFFNHVSYITSAENIDRHAVLIGKIEPLYHFLLRYLDLIEGGEFRNYDKDLSRINIASLLYAFLYLYLIEWTLYKGYHLVKFRNISSRKSEKSKLS